MILAGDYLRARARDALDPEPDPEDFGPCSVDLHPDIAEPRIIESGEHLVVPAAEDVEMPKHLVGVVTGRSTHMRDGMFMPAGFVDPGFETGHGSSLALEFGNTSDGAALLEPDEPAARLTFVQLAADEYDEYDGRYGE